MPPPTDPRVHAARPKPRPEPIATVAALLHELELQKGTGESHLGEALVAHGLISPALLERALAAQARSRPRRPLGQMLVDAGVLSAAQLQLAALQWIGVLTVDLQRLMPQPDALARVSWFTLPATCW